jgi:hypothetical protein
MQERPAEQPKCTTGRRSFVYENSSTWAGILAYVSDTRRFDYDRTSSLNTKTAPEVARVHNRLC